jgi:excisionase family DNA binding protein
VRANDARAQIATITDRIDKRLAAISEHEAAIRAELNQLNSLEPDHPSDSLLSIDEACAWLHVSRATMFRLMSEDGDLRWLKIGKRTLFRPEDIAAYTLAKMAPVRLAS